VTARERSRAAAGIALVAVAAVAVAIAAQLGTWTDEEYTLSTTGRGVSYAFGRALGYELQAPLYFVLEALWRELNASLLWARLPSLACGFGLFFVFLRAGRRVAPSVNPVPFAALASLNPFVVFAAFEIRLYALALVLAGVMWLAFDAGFVDGSSRRARVAFVCASIAAVYVQYFLGFALAGYACTLLVRRPRAFVAYALTCLPIVLAALPLAGWAYRQVGGYAAPQPTLSFLLRHAALHPWVDFVFPYDRDWDIVHGIRTSYDAIVAIAVVALVWARPRLDRVALGWIVCAAAIEARARDVCRRDVAGFDRPVARRRRHARSHRVPDDGGSRHAVSPSRATRRLAPGRRLPRIVRKTGRCDRRLRRRCASRTRSRISWIAPSHPVSARAGSESIRGRRARGSLARRSGRGARAARGLRPRVVRLGRAMPSRRGVVRLCERRSGDRRAVSRARDAAVLRESRRRTSKPPDPQRRGHVARSRHEDVERADTADAREETDLD
jgi:hypothetical protein